jgi:hypothetical protein
MKNTLAVATLMTLITLSAPALVAAAEVASDTEQAKRQALVLPKLQQAASAAARYKNTSIEVKSAPHQITVTVANSKLNDAATTERKVEASALASAIEKSIAGRPEFAEVQIIHVDYVKKVGNSSTMIQSLDFNKTANGAFQVHLT